MSTNTLAKQCRGSLCTAVNALKKQIKRQQETINELTRNNLPSLIFVHTLPCISGWYFIKESMESDTVVILYLEIDKEHHIKFLQCKNSMVEFHLPVNGLLFAGPIKEPVQE